MSLTPQSNSSPSTVSVIAPVFNEVDVIEEFNSRMVNALESMAIDYEIIYVNDGSKDNTLARLIEFKNSSSHVAVINFSRNFGKEVALTAGLDHASGDAMVVIDTDLQDPPELIPDLINKMNEGFDIVYAKRAEREGETKFKKFTALWFYRILRTLTPVEIPEDTGDFRIMSRRAVDQLNKLRERHRFMKGLFSWIGFPQAAIVYDRDQRHAGQTKWNYWKLWNFAIEGITSFSTKPLKISSYLGLTIAFISFVYAVIVICNKIIFGNPVAGYPSLMVVILFLGGVQLITLGVIGEYLARTFSEVKCRSLYIVESYYPSQLGAENAAETR